MKLRAWMFLCFASAAWSEGPQIDAPSAVPPQPREEATDRPAAAPMSVTEKDPQDKKWLIYKNRVLKVQLRVKPEWALMELKETEEVGTVSFTLSRLPRVTFAFVRAPLEGKFESYVSAAALTPLFPTIQKKTSATLAGRKGVLIKGIAEDGRMDESHFSTDGKSFYRVSFSAPEDGWKAAEADFAAIKRSLRWLN